MSTQATTPNPNGNPFDVPLNSEIEESKQRQAATPAYASGYVNPFDEPLASEIAERKLQDTKGANIKPVTTSTNPKLAAAEAAKDMPEYVGATGALAAGAMGTAIAQPVVDA